LFGDFRLFRWFEKSFPGNGCGVPEASAGWRRGWVTSILLSEAGGARTYDWQIPSGCSCNVSDPTRINPTDRNGNGSRPISPVHHSEWEGGFQRDQVLRNDLPEPGALRSPAQGNALSQSGQRHPHSTRTPESIAPLQGLRMRWIGDPGLRPGLACKRVFGPPEAGNRSAAGLVRGLCQMRGDGFCFWDLAFLRGCGLGEDPQE